MDSQPASATQTQTNASGSRAAVANAAVAGPGRSSSHYRQRALQEIRNSLLPHHIMNNDRPAPRSNEAPSIERRPSNDTSKSTYLQSHETAAQVDCNESVRSDSPGVQCAINCSDGHMKQAERVSESGCSSRASSNGLPLTSAQDLPGHQQVHHHPHYYHHVQLGRQHSHQNGSLHSSETPPPLPPPRNATSAPPPPPPPLNGSVTKGYCGPPHQTPVNSPVQNNSGVAASSSSNPVAYQQMIKRMSPVPNHLSNGSSNSNHLNNIVNGASNGSHVMSNGKASGRVQAFSYASSASSSSPQRGSSPVPYANSTGVRRDSASSITTSSSAATNGAL